MRPLRLAIASDWFPPRRGGIEAQLAELAGRMGARGHDVHVLTTTPGARDAVGYTVPRIQVPLIPRLQLAVSPGLYGTLLGMLQTARYDVLHAHVSVVSPLSYAALMAARALGIPAVVTFHSVLRTKAWLLAAASAVARLRESSIVWTAVSQSVASQASGALGVPVDVLSNGIDVSAWAVAGTPAPQPDQRHRDPTIVCVMRLHRKKRLARLLQAFARAAAIAQRSARLVIVGDGPERGVLQREALRLGIQSGSATVEFAGWKESAAIRGVFASADAFVSASRHEAFGIAALEARAAGLPVIAMRAAGSSEFLRDGVDAVLCDDDEDLTRAIALVIRNPAWRQGLGPPDVGRYGWTAVTAAHEEVYLRAMTRVSSGNATGAATV